MSRRSSDPPPQADTTTGKVSGLWALSTSKTRRFAGFVGIPYAKPPVGKLRFMRPEPAEPWEGVRPCKKNMEFIQRNIFKSGNPKAGQEDALVVNVYTPDLKGKLPVMVFIHGGGYVSGSGTRAVYGPDNFMDKDVVLVTFNYRLSVLGALFLDGDLVPGNQMMRDQVLALRWVQENIENFGGSKDKVTIFGESAGAMSVMNHLLSPMSAGLFSAAIAQSGSFFSSFCCLNKHPAHYGYKLVEKLGIDPNLQVEQIVEKLQQLDPIDIQDLGYMFEEFVRAPLAFKPIVDGGLVKDPFLPEEPRELIRKGKYNKVPLIIGCNRNEGLLLKGFYLRDMKNFEKGYKEWNTIGPLAFFAREKDEVQPYESEVCMDFLKKHFKEGRFDSTGKPAEELVEMYGDLIFTAPCELTLKAMAGHGHPIYHYLYNYKGSMSLYEMVVYPPWKVMLHIVLLKLGLHWLDARQGVCHADEMFLLFKPNALPFDSARTDMDKKVRQSLIEMWTDFAKTHDPTPSTKKWTPYNQEDPKFLEITGSGSNMVLPREYVERMKEWTEIYEKVPTGMTYKKSPTWTTYKHLSRYPIEDSAE